MKKKAKYKSLIIASIVLIVLIIYKKQINHKIQEDIIFFKLFSMQNYDSNNNEEKNNQIIFNVSDEKSKEKSINLLDTVNKVYIKEKVAPGTKGSFIIRIKTNKDIKYRLYFQSENDKPKNLVFNVYNNANYYKSLEEISNEMYGMVRKNEEKILPINWKWEYEMSKANDIEDTEDGKKIAHYKFRILMLLE